tara:strand:- start:62 stop:361 length:300 start_codon:yes stop_codon:yes gene_type:complete
MNRNDLIEMYSIWVKPDFLSTEAIASRCADETIRFAKEYHKQQLILNSVVNCNCDESKQLEEEFEIKHLINDTYQVVGKESNTIWKQGTMEECNEWVML